MVAAYHLALRWGRAWRLSSNLLGRCHKCSSGHAAAPPAWDLSRLPLALAGRQTRDSPVLVAPSRSVLLPLLPQRRAAGGRAPAAHRPFNRLPNHSYLAPLPAATSAPAPHHTDLSAALVAASASVSCSDALLAGARLHPVASRLLTSRPPSCPCPMLPSVTRCWRARACTASATTGWPGWRAWWGRPPWTQRCACGGRCCATMGAAVWCQRMVLADGSRPCAQAALLRPLLGAVCSLSRAISASRRLTQGLVRLSSLPLTRTAERAAAAAALGRCCSGWRGQRGRRLRRRVHWRCEAVW